MSHRLLRRPGAVAAAAALTLVLASCSSPSSTSAPPAPTSTGAGVALVGTPLQIPDALADGPFDEAREVQAPQGWSVSLWGRVDEARLAAWTPDDRLLVSRPDVGDVVLLTPGDGEPASSTLLSGLNQPHGLAFAGDTLYVAQSDRVDAYPYADGAVGDPQPVADGLPDAKSDDLRGAYAHALKSVTVDDDGAVYVSVGSTGNASEEDRSADPERATVLRVPPGGGEPAVFARGVRNGTGLAVGPDGAVWTAVNDRDNIAYPYDRAYTADGEGPSDQVYADRPFVRDVDTNADGARLDCDALAPVEQGMGAHSAPLGLAFATDLPGGLGDQQTLLGGFQDEDGARWGRPVMAVQGPDDAVHVTDDDAGAVYRMVPPGS